MRLDADGDVEIARRRAHACRRCLCPAPAAASRCERPAGMRTSTVSVRATRPSPSQVGQALRSLPVPLAARAGQVELHRAGHLGHVAGAVALRADVTVAAAPSAGAVAGVADFLARDVQPGLRALDRLPEIDVERVLEVGALFGAAPAAAAPAARRRTG